MNPVTVNPVTVNVIAFGTVLVVLCIGMFLAFVSAIKTSLED